MTTALKLFSSMATKELLARVCPLHANASGQAVDAISIGGVDVNRRIRGGEAFDAAVLAADNIDKLIAEGLLAPGRVDLVRSGIAVAVRRGASRPALSDEAAVRDAVRAAPSVSYSTGPSGVYLEKLFERWGIADEIRPRIVQAPPGVPVGQLVAEGKADLGFQQLSELKHLAGIDVIGPLPAAIQLVTTFSAGVSANCARPEAVRALLAFINSPAADAARLESGMEAA
ncbi:MAG: substrate-binding domain-containing protein [Burkholderiales bacterium]|nr:substrate-binding domain-containing protein [Burkholderiales bacterium]